MKKSLSTSMLIPIAILIFTACETKQPVEQVLKNDAHHFEITSLFLDHHPDRTDMSNAMMVNDSCQLWTGQKMIDKPEMTDKLMSDPPKMKGSMNHTVDMAVEDTVMSNVMILMMNEKPEMWNKVTKLNSSTNLNN